MDFEAILAGLRAAAEPTRLRILALCAQADLMVSELTQILGQSQPRVSRHLKVLCEAGLLERSREGTSAYFHLARNGAAAELARHVSALLLGPGGTARTVPADVERLEAVKTARAQAAAAYFEANAARWDQIRSLHVDEAEVERALVRALDGAGIGDLLDIGTGTGRILEVLGPRAQTGTGLDLSREMLAVARSKLDRAGLHNCSVRQGDMYRLPWPPRSFDTVVFHQVLHYAEDPAGAVAEAARVLRPGGRLVVVDFAPHDRAELREAHAHRHLGFADDDIARWCRKAGVAPGGIRHLKGKPLTVTLWLARKPGAAPKAAPVRGRQARPAEGKVEA